MDRRSFIKLTAITGSTAALASCGTPENHVIRFVPDEELVPGVAEWKPSVCPLCGGGCGVSVRVMEADVETSRNGQQGVVRMGVAKKLEGNAAHPVNQGGLCPRGQAGIQVTYHPDRVVQPLKRSGSRADGKFDVITWDAAIAELVSRLDAIDADATSLAVIIGAHRGHRRALFEQFAAKFGAPAPVVYQVFDEDVLRRANLLSFGHEQLPTFDLANARFVISFGADLLGTWNSPVAQNAGYGHMRQGRPGVRGAFVQVESRMTTTGASADEWVPANPGTDGVLALALAHVILREKLRPAAAGRAAAQIDGWSAGLADYAPDKAEKVTGVAAVRIERLARAFVAESGAVAMAGGPALAHTNALFTALAVNALNELAGSVQQPGGVFFTPQLSIAGAAAAPAGARTTPASAPRQTLGRFAADLIGGTAAPKVLLVDGANPAFSAPRAWKVREALDKIPFIVSFGSFIDETGALADLVLPDHSFLESWTDALPESGSIKAVASVAGPAMKPLFQTRATGDVLLDVAHKLKKPLDLPWQTYDEMLKASFDPLGEDAWSTAQKQGGWWGDLPPARAASPGGSAGTASGEAGTAAGRPVPARFSEPTFDGEPGQYPFHFLPYPSQALLDGSLAHLPWLQELPDPLTTAMWSTWVEVNPKTAEQFGIQTGDLVEVASRVGAVRAPAFVSPAIAPNLVAMPAGQGHTTYTRYASGRGANPIEILAPVAEPSTGSLAWAATRVKLTRVGDPDGRLVLFSSRGELREVPREGETR